MLKSLEAKNWCQHERLELTFDAGLNGLLGSNGKGKSNILNAIRYLDTGESHPAGPLADNVMWGKDSCWVSGEYEVGEHKFSLKRTINTSGKTTVQLKVHGGQTYNKNGEVIDELDKIFQANKAARLKNVYIPQGELDAILFQKSAERYAEFQKTFNMDNLKEAHDWLRIEANAHEITPDLAAILQTATEALSEAGSEADELARKQAELQSLVNQLATCESVLALAIEATRSQKALDYADNAVSKATTDVAEAKLALDVATAEEARARISVDMLRNQAQEIEQAVRVLETQHAAFQNGQESRKRLQALLASKAALTPRPTAEQVADANTKRSAAETEVHRLTAVMANPPELPEEQKCKQDKSQATAELVLLPNLPPLTNQEQSLLFEAEAVERHVKLVEQGKCPTCNADFSSTNLGELVSQAATLRNEFTRSRAASTAAHKVHRSELEHRIQLATEMINKFDATRSQVFRSAKDAAHKLWTELHTEQRSLEALVAQHVSVDGDLAITQAKLQGVPDVAPDISTIKAQKQFLDGFRSAELQIHTLVTTKAMKQQCVNGAEAALKAAHGSLANLGEAIAMPSPEAIAQAQNDAQLLLEARKNLQEVLQQVGINQALMKHQTGEVTRLREKLVREGNLAKWVEVIKIARDALHVTALPALAMREFARVINVRLEHYLTLWESPFRMWLDDDMAFQVEFKDGSKCAAIRLSGGQKIFASTSFRLAMSDTFTASVGMLVLDEPGAYLDVDNMQHLQTLLLKLKQTASGLQFLIVNHGEQLTGFLDNVIQI